MTAIILSGNSERYYRTKFKALSTLKREREGKSNFRPKQNSLLQERGMSMSVIRYKSYKGKSVFKDSRTLRNKEGTD